MPESNDTNGSSETCTSSDLISIDDLSKVQLCVAEIKEAQLHPKADRLLLLKVDLGEENLRQVVAGIKASYEPESLVGKQIIVVRNLAPAVLRGERSEGMLLAASSDQGGPVLLTTDRNVKPGAQVR
jgi:methionine--tRNA ligase beta chain